ncbi:hypothetical protein [Planomicrobium sp. CPCC 101079]|uniref:hypothetical protein n=1 Tax=Planomicrobium sp. CPCC 101079 TaxID=2599618 RepID=UPI0011B54A6A|nr:hypothetical protein [Planomicrobium sp. CPCC 101079]TWT01874.1 hypothetical protein FQV28_14680 [Planomicrobium sp. CPCC 101079]
MAVQAYAGESQSYFSPYLLFAALGLVAGILTRLTDFFPSGDLWSFSSIATLFGFWMVTVTLVIYVSRSNKDAAVNVLLYLFMMNFGFYFLNYILGLFIPLFYTEGVQWDLFIVYNLLALICSAVGYVLYYWNRSGRLSSFLYALPVSGLAAETVGVGIYLAKHQTFLFQFLFDIAGLIVFGGWFYRKANNKLLYIAAIAVVSSSSYFLVYQPFL